MAEIYANAAFEPLSLPPVPDDTDEVTALRAPSVPAALAALAGATFAVGTSEFAPVGVLPQIANSFDAPVATTGLLITAYAVGVIVGAPLLIALTNKLRRHHVVVVALALTAIAGFGSAAATNLTQLTIARFVAGGPQGVVFGVGAVLATSDAVGSRAARAVAVVFAGFTLAPIVGVCAVTAVGRAAGWRATFVVVGVIALISCALVAAFVRSPSARADTGMRQELRALRSSDVWFALAVTTIGFGGVFASFTYIAPLLTHSAGFSASSVPWLLPIFGLGMAIGNSVSGRVTERLPRSGICVLLFSLALTLFGFVFTVHSQAAALGTLLLVGMFGFATVPALQTRIVAAASSAPTLASTLNLSAFNIANALGAYLGGIAISTGLGYPSVNWVGGLLAAGGAALAALWGLRK